MTNKRRTEITIETRTVTIIRTRKKSSVFCETCQAEVQVFSPPQIISGLCLNDSEVRQLFLAQEIHFAGQTEMLCGNSLAEYFRKK